jgi:hypothetical protein
VELCLDRKSDSLRRSGITGMTLNLESTIQLRAHLTASSREIENSTVFNSAPDPIERACSIKKVKLSGDYQFPFWAVATPKCN